MRPSSASFDKTQIVVQKTATMENSALLIALVGASTNGTYSRHICGERSAGLVLSVICTLFELLNPFLLYTIYNIFVETGATR